MILQFLFCMTLFCRVLSEQIIVCYWLHENGRMSSIDPHICTHISYAFVTLDSTSLTIRFQTQSEAHCVLRKLKCLKTQNPKLKIVAALGGGGDGGDGKYGRMVLNPQFRSKFVNSCVQFLNQNGFDGLDFDWEYPACPQTNCDAKHAPEKAGFAAVLEELRDAFNKNNPKLTLSVAVNAGKWLTDNAYVYQTMASALDFINVMTYDNAGSWLNTTGHHSGFEWSKQSMLFWAAQGVPKNKLLMGIPFYGLSFTLKNAAQHGLNAPVDGTSGFMTYYQICNSIKRENWKKENSVDGPIAYHGNQWIGYDDPISAAHKAEWIRDNGFGGVLVWEVGQDDINGYCCKQAKPMLNALGYGLFGKGANPNSYGCY